MPKLNNTYLQTLLEEVLRRYFGDYTGKKFTIGWSRSGKGYWEQNWAHIVGRKITISRQLLYKPSPKYFMRYLIAHEVLHSIVRSRRVRGQHTDHPPEFYGIERLWPDTVRALAWEKRKSHK